MKIVNVAEMRRIEQITDADGHSYAAMMEAAGRAVADAAIGNHLIEPEEGALVLVGPGNNGGDGLVAARFLRQAGHDVVIYVWKRDIKKDENFRLLKRRRRGVAILWAENDPDFSKLREEINRTALIVDALLGTGVDRPLDARLVELLTVVWDAVTERRRLDAEERDFYRNTPSSTPLLSALMAGQPLPPQHDTFGEPSEPFQPPLSDDLPEEFEHEDDEDDLFDDLDDFWLDDDEESIWPPAPILAVDCPSGLNCDTGEIDPHALHADITLTFGYVKWGQLQYPGANYCGFLQIADIGIPEKVAEFVRGELVGPYDARDLLPQRQPDAHKGTFGKVLVVGGSLDYTGAIVLSGAAAVRAGAGLVTAAIPRDLHSAVAGLWPELTWLPLPTSDEGGHMPAGAARVIERLVGYQALLVGPGLTTHAAADGFVNGILSKLDQDAWQGRAIWDADALNILASQPEWWRRLPPGSILTPHPGEMGRLTGLTPEDVNGCRIGHALRYAQEWSHIVLLKGPHSVVAAPDGRVRVLPFATAALATAGSGDVLAGVIAGLIAQGLDAFDAATLGAYVHGFAGILCGLVTPALGVSARDILNQIPVAAARISLNRNV